MGLGLGIGRGHRCGLVNWASLMPERLEARDAHGDAAAPPMVIVGSEVSVRRVLEDLQGEDVRDQAQEIRRKSRGVRYDVGTCYIQALAP